MRTGWKTGRGDYGYIIKLICETENQIFAQTASERIRIGGEKPHVRILGAWVQTGLPTRDKKGAEFSAQRRPSTSELVLLSHEPGYLVRGYRLDRQPMPESELEKLGAKNGESETLRNHVQTHLDWQR